MFPRLLCACALTGEQAQASDGQWNERPGQSHGDRPQPARPRGTEPAEIGRAFQPPHSWGQGWRGPARPQSPLCYGLGTLLCSLLVARMTDDAGSAWSLRGLGA